ncbi:hypothetical protein L228DRAFT_261536 [Xylona heveae TC161]|uniref:Uncharacterized protein n=1 Tax=Xylona heveae (strain CBS 132557 / TC161) TaxID=1328760 RepID=A0A165GM15_XYLHT|nr:hypothetical protein L228DRAFT_261536 [Xylona heveae TC161]KZF22358.1 hypothetical protein L228DRAFT_261536 [Xylona heveae TC161]
MSRPFAQRLLRSAVCPSAPFLLPLRSNGPVHGAWGLVALSPSTRRCMASKSKRRKSRSKLLESELAQENKLQGQLETVLDFRAELQSFSLQPAMVLYPHAIKTKLLEGKDTRELARLVHNTYRSTRNLSKEQKEALAAQIETIVEDLKQERLPHDPIASLHIISYYKDSQQFDQGLDFWKWLLQQDESCADARTYGAAIELLAYQGVPLEVLEELYQYALKRFPGDYSEYHLAPDAILADRSQPIAMSGTRMSLLQGILTARILHGDWQGAYLGLDVALRLYPTQVPQRIFELFIYERPLSEAYKVFLMACRAGVVLKPNVLNVTLEGLGRAEELETTVQEKLSIISAMLNAVRAYAGAGGVPDGVHLGVIVRNLLSLMPPNTEMNFIDEGADAVPAENAENSATDIDILIYDLLGSIMETFAQMGINPTIATFNSIISIGGDLKRQELIDLAIRALHSSELEPTAVTYRALVTAAGELQDEESVKDAWGLLEEAALLRAEKQAVAAGLDESNTPQPKLDKLDWKVLARACRRINDVAFVREQVEKGVFVLDGNVLALIERELGREDKKSANEAQSHASQSPQVSQVSQTQSDTKENVTDQTSSGAQETMTIQERISAIDTQLSEIHEIVLSGKLLDASNSPFIPMSLDENECAVFAPESVLPTPNAPANAKFEDSKMREIYDKFTTDIQSLQYGASSSAASESDSYCDSADAENGSTAQGEEDAKVDEPKTTAASQQLQGLPQGQSPIHFSSTNYTLAELRYVNWVSINELLFDARLNEIVKQTAVDQAMKESKPFERGRDAKWRCGLGMRRKVYRDAGGAAKEADWEKCIAGLRRWRKE